MLAAKDEAVYRLLFIGQISNDVQQCKLYDWHSDTSQFTDAIRPTHGMFNKFFISTINDSVVIFLNKYLYNR